MIRKKEEKDEKKFVNPLQKTRTLGTEITFAKQTKAGNNKPAFGTSGARSFKEYSAIRKQQEQEDGMKSAADRLASQYGYKRVGNQVVFVTPNSPLPKPTAQNTATKAQAPGVYGIQPDAFVQGIKDISYKHDNETQSFFDKYFGGKLPTEEEYRNTYRNLIDQGKLSEDEMMSFHANQDMLRKATEAEQRKKDAIELLGEDAINYAGLTDAELYEIYGKTYGAADVAQTYMDEFQKPKSGFESFFANASDGLGGKKHYHGCNFSGNVGLQQHGDASFVCADICEYDAGSEADLPVFGW